MDQEQFKKRTKELTLAVVRLVESLPRKRSAGVMGRQLLRAATSGGANYRAACRGQSPADMIAKLHIVLEEADETAYWELLSESEFLSGGGASSVQSGAHEIAAMTVASL
jgi:four helix bundle protein